MLTKKDKIRELEDRLKEIEATMHRNPNVIWEGSFKEQVRIVTREGLFSKNSKKATSTYIQGAGVIREFKSSNFVIVTLAKTGEITIFDKDEIVEINLDSKKDSKNGQSKQSS